MKRRFGDSCIQVARTALLVLLASGLPCRGLSTNCVTRRVGSLTVPVRPGFEAAADESGGVLHFIFRKYEKLYHVMSTDGGTTWSGATLAADPGMTADVAVDSAGVLHMVYCHKRDNSAHHGDQIWYASCSNGTWATPIRISAPGGWQMCPRIAVDGADNAHVMWWGLGIGPENHWGNTCRTLYTRKAAGATGFEPIEEWQRKDGTGGAMHGALAVDAAGHVHAVYRSVLIQPDQDGGSWVEQNLERRIRYKGGGWAATHDKFTNVKAADFGIGAAVGADGVLHVSEYDIANPRGVCYRNNRAAAGSLALIRREEEDWEPITALHLGSDGDVWISSVNDHTVDPGQSLRASYIHRRATGGAWDARVNLSPAGYQNVDEKIRDDSVPRWVAHAGKLYLFYAEKAPGESYKFYMRVFGEGTAPLKPANLAALSLSATSIQVTWTDTSDNETQFKIRRSLDGADWDTLAPVFPAANATSYTDSGLSGGTTYYYKIRSENAAGVSAYTAPVTATTGVATPAAPSGLTATAVSSTSVALSWTDNASNETRYKIDRRRSGTDTWVRVAEPGANTTRHTDSGLSPNTHYYYMVKASNAAGDSPYSAVAAVTTPVELESFTAYNDLAWASGQLAQNITVLTRGEAGALVDHASGQTLGVQLAVGTGGDGPILTQGAKAVAGTDADAVFGGIVDCAGLIGYASANLTLTLSGLDPAKRYELVLFGNRHNASYTTRLTTVTLSDVTAFSNRSSAGAEFASESDPAVVIRNGYNTENGYVARYAGIDPGADGDVLVTIADGTSRFYLNALMLRGGDASQQEDVTKIVKGASWRYRKGTTEASDPAGAWRRTAFDDSGWASGRAPIGYASTWTGGTELTDMLGSYSCVYLRKRFVVSDPAQACAMNVEVDYDDAFILWVNGEELARVNAPGLRGDAVPADSFALENLRASWSAVLTGADLPNLVPGSNAVAVQVLNRSLTSGDLLFDMALSVTEGSPLPAARDSDGDGMDDGWEQIALQGSGAAADGDADGDGLSNLQEYIAGSDPDAGEDGFGVEVSFAGGKVVVSFVTVAAAGASYEGVSRYYALEQTSGGEGNGGWIPCSGYAKILGASQTVRYEPTDAEQGRLYRARVWLE